MARPQRVLALVCALALCSVALAKVPPRVEFEVDEKNGQTDLVFPEFQGGGGPAEPPGPAVGGQITFTDSAPPPHGVVVAHAVAHTEKISGGRRVTNEEEDAANRDRKRTEAFEGFKSWLEDLRTNAGAKNLRQAALDAVKPTLMRIRRAQQKTEREIDHRNKEFLSHLEKEVTDRVFNSLKMQFARDMGSEEADLIMIHAKVLASDAISEVTRQFFGQATESESGESSKHESSKRESSKRESSHHESSHEASHPESSHHESSKAESSESALMSSLSSILSEESSHESSGESSHESAHESAHESSHEGSEAAHESSHEGSEAAHESSHEASHEASESVHESAHEASESVFESSHPESTHEGAEESSGHESGEHSEHAEGSAEFSEEASEGSFPHESVRFRQQHHEAPRMTRLQSLLHQIQNSRVRGFRFREIPRA